MGNGGGAFSVGVKRLGRETRYTDLHLEVNEWNYTSTSLCAFMEFIETFPLLRWTVTVFYVEKTK
jgi:hypothetical protein